jgi:hypothetical protein
MALAQNAQNAPHAQNAPYPQQPVPQAQANQGGQPVDTRVNRELYGNDRPTNVPLYGPQFEPLPSEALLATQRSGALPSEIRAQQNAVGPLAPYGAASYIPAESPLQRANRVRPPALWGPSYVGQRMPSGTGAPAPNPSASVQQDVIPGERRTEVPPSPRYVTPQAMPSGYRLSANPDVLSREETTTYRILPRTRPLTTQPTTQPSLGALQK